MEINDFKVMVCDKCHARHYYYAPYTTNEDEIEEYKVDFEVQIDDKFHFSGKCHCGGNTSETKELVAQDYSEILGNILEDDNRHNITNIGNVVMKCCDSAGADENIKNNILKYLAKYYELCHSF